MRPYGAEAGWVTGAEPAGLGLRAAAPTSGPAHGPACAGGVVSQDVAPAGPPLEPLEGSAGCTQIDLVSDVTGITIIVRACTQTLAWVRS